MGRQRGAALVVVLSLLAMSLMLGISGMQSAQIDERLAGNYRSSAIATMAAEYGAAEAWDAILEIRPGNTSEISFWSSMGSEITLNDIKVVPGYGDSNITYRIVVGSSTGLDIPVSAIGEVYEKSGQSSPIAVRQIQILARLHGLGAGNLSPLNVAALGNYKGMTSQAGVTGEQIVDGTRNPAITASSKEEALKIVNDIVNNDSRDYTFVPDADGSGHGVFYASSSVVNGQYSGNYADCNSGNNRMCNYKGGVATRSQDYILSDANRFHAFISAIFSDAYTSPSSTSLSGNMSGFNIASLGSHLDENGNYRPLRTACGSEVCPVRQTFTGSGNAAGEGLLIIDGNVEFNGNPEFKGLIIVLGNYTIKGGWRGRYGGGNYRGAL